MKPYVVSQPGESLARILEETGSTDEAVRRHPSNREIFGDDGAMVAPLYPGDVVHVRAPDVAQVPIQLQHPNDIVGKRNMKKVEIKVLDANGEPEAEGTAYRLTIILADAQKVVLDGTLDARGVIAREVPVGSLRLEWVELPVSYSLHQSTSSDVTSALAGYRERLFRPGTVAEMEADAKSTIDPNAIDFSDGGDLADEDGSAHRDGGHMHHVLAKKIDSLRKRALPKVTTSADARTLWDNRWFAVRPLLSPWFPVPRKLSASPRLLDRVYREKVGPIPLMSPKAGVEAGEVRGAKPWYDREHTAMNLLGSAAPPLTRTNAFTTLATATNKRLVRLWMGELLNIVPAAEHPTLTQWFSSEQGREHFQNWCGLVTVIGHVTSDGEHAAGHAIDIDKRFNPWAPVYSSETRRIIGEPAKGIPMDPVYGRIYDRALRLFLGSETDGRGAAPTSDDLDSAFFAPRYFRNAWDWTPDSLHKVIQRYQVWNWALIAYFDYRYQRALVPKPAWPAVDGWKTYTDPCRPPPGTPNDAEIWGRVEKDFEDGVVARDATLVFESAPPAIGPFAVAAAPGEPARLRPAEELNYPFGAAMVWKASLREILAATKTEASRAAMGAALRRQIESDHAKLTAGAQCDPCRGVYNLSYDVALAFGRMLQDSRELRYLRMLSFGNNNSASGGDFMHIDYRSFNVKTGAESMRDTDYLALEVDGQKLYNETTCKVGVEQESRLTVSRKQVFPTSASTDVTLRAEARSSDESVCKVARDDSGWVLRGVAEGRCSLTVTCDGMGATQKVRVAR